MSTIVRTSSGSQFLMADSHAFRNPKLSWKAKGILAYILSMPDNHKIDISELSKKSLDGRDATRSGIDELRKAGYIFRMCLHDKEGKFKGYKYLVSDRPMETSEL